MKPHVNRNLFSAITALPGIVSLSAVILLAGAMPSPAAAQGHLVLIVAPQTDTTLTETGALKVVQAMTGKLRDICGPLRVQFGFSPLPASFQGPGDGGSHEALRRFRDTQTSLQVVPSISRCPTPPAPGGRFGGCTPETGPILLRDGVTATSNDRARLAQIWAHEIGHAQGLIGNFPGYSGGHNPSDRALMFWRADLARWAMNGNECTTYYAPQKFPPPRVSAIVETDEAAPQDGMMADGQTGSQAPDAPAPFELIDIEPTEPAPPEPSPETATDDFLRGDWLAGLPLAEMQERQQDLLPAALAAIAENRVELWPGSVIVIAFSAPADAVQPLERVLTADPAELQVTPGSDAAYQLNEAKIRAAGALSYVVYRTASGEYDGGDQNAARDWLDRLVSPQGNLDLPLAEDGRDRTLLSQEIALNAIAGIALIAGFDDDALARLQTQRSGNRSGADQFGVDDEYFGALEARVQFDRANRSPRTVPLAEALGSLQQQ